MADDTEGRWITVNGAPVLVKEGQDPGEAIKQRFGSGGDLKKWGQRRLGAPSGRRSEAGQGKLSEDKRTMVKSAIDKVRREIDRGGQLKAGASLADHTRIAKSEIAKHEADFAHTKSELNTIAGTLGPPPATVKGRVKKLDSALGKIERKAADAREKTEKTGKPHFTKYKTVSDLQDTTGMRVVAHTTDDVKKAVAAVRAKNDVLEEENYIDEPKPGMGYRSHHLIIKTPAGVVKEIQIRTKRQDVHAMWAHNAYKPQTPAQEKALKEHKDAIEKYSTAVSEHFHAKDSGRGGTRMPPCPPEVRAHFGAIEDM